MTKKKVQADEKLPDTKKVKTSSGKEYTIGKPMMKHRHEVAKIIKSLEKVANTMDKNNTLQRVEEVAKKMGVSIESLADTKNIPEKYKAYIQGNDEALVDMDIIADFQLEIVYSCLKEAEFDWDPITGTMEDLEVKLAYEEGLELMRHCIPYIMKSFPSQKQKKH